MILAGIDQSLTGTGITIYNNSYKYYLLESFKEKSSSPSIEYTRRLMSIVRDIKEILIFHNVDAVAIEGMSFGSKGRAIFELGGLSHMIREMMLIESMKFIVSPPTVIKKYWTGKGNASKDVMIEEAYNKSCDINITKNYGTKKEPNIKYDDNIVDSRALCDFIKDYFDKKLNGLEEQIEMSWL
jgi:crossover junction endodeoxyribonuclease RuvC